MEETNHKILLRLMQSSIFCQEVCINLHSIDRASLVCLRNYIEIFCRGKMCLKACLQVVLLQVEPLRSLELLVQDEKAGPHLQFDENDIVFLTFLQYLHDLKKMWLQCQNQLNIFTFDFVNQVSFGSKKILDTIYYFMNKN